MDKFLLNVSSPHSKETRLAAVRVIGALLSDIERTPSGAFDGSRIATIRTLRADYSLNLAPIIYNGDTKFYPRCCCSVADLARVEVDEKLFLSCPSFVNPLVTFSVLKADDICAANKYKLKQRALPVLETIYAQLAEQCKKLVSHKSHSFIVDIGIDLREDVPLSEYLFRQLREQGWTLKRWDNSRVFGKGKYRIFSKK